MGHKTYYIQSKGKDEQVFISSSNLVVTEQGLVLEVQFLSHTMHSKVQGIELHRNTKTNELNLISII